MIESTRTKIPYIQSLRYRANVNASWLLIQYLSIFDLSMMGCKCTSGLFHNALDIAMSQYSFSIDFANGA